MLIIWYGNSYNSVFYVYKDTIRVSKVINPVND